MKQPAKGNASTAAELAERLGDEYAERWSLIHQRIASGITALRRHGALLAAIENLHLACGISRIELRAAVDLHEPELFAGIWACLACSPGTPPPLLVEWSDCATSRAIARALGVALADDPPAEGVRR